MGVLSSPSQILSSRVPAQVIARTVARLSVQDRLLLVYLVYTWVAAVLGSGPDRAASIAVSTVLGAVYVATLLAVRGLPSAGGFAGPIAYRLQSVFTVVVMYLGMRYSLPTANPRSYDVALYRLDLAIFGVEPTLWADRLVTPALTEWLSFFYYSYFYFMAVHVLPTVFARREWKHEFGLGILGVVCIGHMLYYVVPGFGPWIHLAGSFPHELPHGRWYNLVLEVVHSSGANKDIFPSLHTAVPTVLTLLSFRHRHDKPWRYTWPISAFFAVNMIAATIYLRWHWAVDVFAGFALAVTCALAARPIARWEKAHREKNGLGETWPKLGWEYGE